MEEADGSEGSEVRRVESGIKDPEEGKHLSRGPRCPSKKCILGHEEEFMMTKIKSGTLTH